MDREASTQSTDTLSVGDPADAVARHVAGLRDLLAELDPAAVPVADAPAVWGCSTSSNGPAPRASCCWPPGWSSPGCGPTRAWPPPPSYLAARSGCSLHAGTQTLHTSKRLTDLPQIDTALRRGDLSTAQTHAIADAASQAPHRQQRLLDAAGSMNLRELRTECLRTKAAADPDPETTRRRIHDSRYFRQGTDAQGAWTFSGRGNPEHAAAFNAALTPIIDQLFHQARKEGRRERHEQYAYDALQELAHRATNPHDHDKPDNNADDHQPAPTHTTTTPHPGSPAPADTPPTGHNQPAPTDSTAAAHQTPPPPGPGHHPRRRDSHRNRTPHGPDSTAAPTNPATPDAPATTVGGTDPAPNHPTDTPTSSPGQPPTQPPAASRPPEPPAGTGRPHTQKRRRKRRRQPTLNQMAILRIDLEALRRGHIDGDETCEITGIGPISVPAAREALGHAILKLVITKGTDVATVVHLGRGPTAAQKVALLWSQPTCTAAGCSRTFTQTDHRINWHTTHQTRLTELDRLCPHHHRLKTHHNWALTPGTGKRPIVPPTDPRHPNNQPDNTNHGQPPADNHPNQQPSPQPRQEPEPATHQNAA